MPESHLSFLLSKLDLQASFSPRFVQVWRCTIVPVPVLTAVDRPCRSRRRHHRGEPLVLIFFLKEKNSYLYDLDSYLYNFLTCIIVCYYIVPWFWYPPPSALVWSMIRMWYIIFYNYLFHLVFMRIMPTNVTQMFLSRRYVNRKFQPTLLSRG